MMADTGFQFCSLSQLFRTRQIACSVEMPYFQAVFQFVLQLGSKQNPLANFRADEVAQIPQQMAEAFLLGHQFEALLIVNDQAVRFSTPKKSSGTTWSTSWARCRGSIWKMSYSGC